MTHDVTPNTTEGRPTAVQLPALHLGLLTLWQRYAFAAAVTVATLGLRLALDGPLEGRPTLVMFTVPIMLGAYVGGLGAGLLATGLSLLLSAYYVLPPVHSFQIASVPQRWDECFIGLAGVVISASLGALYRARSRDDIETRTQQQRVQDDRQRFFTLSRDLLCILGFDGYFTDLNPAWEHTLGYTNAELLAMPFIEFVHPDDRAATLAEANAVAGGKALVAFENRYRCKDGSYRWLQWAVTPVVGSSVMYGVAHDVTERRLVDEALAKASILETAIFNSANFSCIATDAKGVIQIFNVGAERMLGYTAAEVVNVLTPDVLSDQDELVARAAALSVEYGIPITPGFDALVFRASRGIEDIYELTQLRKDGSRFPALVSVTALRDARKAVIGYLLIGTDNTARKAVEEERQRAEEARRTSEVRYRTLFERAPDGIVIADPRSYYLDANGAICRMLGYTREEFIGLHASDIVIETEVPHIGVALSALETPAPYEREWCFRRKDGSMFDADVIAVKMPDGNLMAVIRDITDRKHADKQAADALRALEDLKAAIDEHAIVAITDASGKITFANDKFCALSKYSREELIGQNHRIVNSGLHPKAFMRRMWETITDGRVWKGEFQNRAKDGGLYWVDATIVPYLDHKGTPVQYISIRTDVTECKRVESALQKKNVELEEASRMKSEFLANMSHELRTPLNAIIGFSEVLKDGLLGELSERQRKFVGDIFGSGTHLLSLINDILDLSKVEAGKMTLDLELVPVHALLSNGLSIVREKAAARGIHVDMAASDDLVSIHADPRKLTQIVYNLLSNAVKFSPDGGHVTLRARVVSRGAVGQPSCAWPGRSLSLANSPFTEFLEVRVTDDGIGMPQEALAQLFRPFTQIDSGLSREFEGTGLGLAMVKLLAELHGGAVAVESAVGQGSCFTVWLPARTSDAEAPMRVSAGAISRARGRFGVRTALVVEDDAKAADLIRMQLEAEGFTVVHAATAETAVVLAGQQPLSLITLDMLLPTMDGWELLGRFKQVPDLARVPVVIMSIVADSDRGFALGAAAVLQKPVARQDFYHALVDLGLLPVAEGRALRVLICDDDAKALELYAFSILGLAGTIIRAHGGQEAIALAQQELPDVIVLDLVMPDVGGLDVVAALQLRPDTARIPVLVVTAQGITAEDRARLRGYRTTIMGQSEFNADRFAAEVSGPILGRDVVA